VLVITEVALSALLLIAASLLVRSFSVVLHQNAGFDATGVVVGRIWVPVPNNPSANKYLDARRQAALAEVLVDRLQRLPGVDRAALGTSGDMPLAGDDGRSKLSFSLPDERNTQKDDHVAQVGAVTAQYFATLGIKVVRGRAFTAHDDRSAPTVAVVNETFVRRFAPGRDAVGQRLRVGSNADITIVGVAADVHDAGLDVTPEPRVYYSLLQRPTVALSIFVRSRDDAASTARAVSHMVHEVDPDLPVFGLRTTDELISASLARRRFVLALMSGFAVAAVLLAALGIYGVMAFLVAQRRQEFGIRSALGATPMNIIAIALRPGLVLSSIGTVIGVAAALGVTRVMSSLLFGVSAHDLATFIAVPVLLLAVASAACLGPARRATRFDPTTALRG
jgi:putative ABC transport system permease protein